MIGSNDTGRSHEGEEGTTKYAKGVKHVGQ
jgi:hypothetical protein